MHRPQAGRLVPVVVTKERAEHVGGREGGALTTVHRYSTRVVVIVFANK
jgi:hypothetical protein